MDENKYRNEYQERQPKMRPVKDMFNQEFVVMALLFVADDALPIAIRLATFALVEYA